MLKYTVILVPEEDGAYSVEVPALPGCYTQGETREEAINMAKEAIELYVESSVAHGEEVQEETIPPVIATVEVRVPSEAGVP